MISVPLCGKIELKQLLAFGQGGGNGGVVADCLKGLRVGWVGPLGLQLELPPADVEPAAQLVADAGVNADRAKADRFVQADAGVVRQRNAGNRFEEALPAKD
jgi:hypothetical protein